MKILFGVGIFVMLLFLLGCQTEINSFEDCVAAGNPIMESYPRQCSDNGQTFVEEVATSTLEFYQCGESDKNAEACTLEYDPVCAFADNGVRCVTEPCPSTDVVTVNNGCTSCMNGAYGYYKGSCESQLFVLCKETVTGFSAEEYALSNNGVCVGICPSNFDSFVTQIGVEVCIPNYGVEEVNQWEICEKSSENCECVKAYETTEGEAIDNAEYRCVPELYSNRMLFRGGLDRLDESGEQSVVIA